MDYQCSKGHERGGLNRLYRGLVLLCAITAVIFAHQHTNIPVLVPSDAQMITPLLHVSLQDSLSSFANHRKANDNRWPQDIYQDEWPIKSPRELAGPDRFDNCEVSFRDSSMATCHVGAFNGNFGDMLGPDITKRILEYRFGCSADNLRVIDFEINNVTDGPCLWTVGSIFRYIQPNDHAWGSGSHGKWLLEFSGGPCARYPKQKGKSTPAPSANNITIYSVRGPQTAEMVQEYCVKKVQTYRTTESQYSSNLSDLPDAGDAGFLIPFLFPEVGVPRDDPPIFDFCIILHKYDERRNTTATRQNRTIQLLPVVQPWRTMATNVSRCRLVVSSSLHGLILADAFGIPSRRIKMSKFVLDFKFLDYYNSIGFVNKGVGYQPPLKVILKNKTLPLPNTQSYANRSAYAQKILQSFPFHLFHVQPKGKGFIGPYSPPKLLNMTIGSIG